MNFITQHLDTIIVAVIAIILGLERLRSGNSTLRKEIAADYKERNEQLESRLKDFEKHLQETNLELAKLKGIVDEKDNHIKSLTEVLQGRNPEMLELLKEISVSNVKIKEFMATMYEVLTKELSKQTIMLEEDKVRSQKIEQASTEHKSVPLRIPKSSKKKK